MIDVEHDRLLFGGLDRMIHQRAAALLLSRLPPRGEVEVEVNDADEASRRRRVEYNTRFVADTLSQDYDRAKLKRGHERDLHVERELNTLLARWQAAKNRMTIYNALDRLAQRGALYVLPEEYRQAWFDAVREVTQEVRSELFQRYEAGESIPWQVLQVLGYPLGERLPLDDLLHTLRGMGDGPSVQSAIQQVERLRSAKV